MNVTFAGRGHSAEIEGCIFDADRFSLASSNDRAWQEVIGAYGKTRAPLAASVNVEQQRQETLVRLGGVMAYREALRLVETLHAVQWPMAVASRSRNADDMLRQIRLRSGIALFDVFGTNACGYDRKRGRPDAEIFVLAAEALGVAAGHCHVLEGVPAGIEGARAEGMKGYELARFGAASSLRDAGANVVIRSFYDLTIVALCGERVPEYG